MDIGTIIGLVGAFGFIAFSIMLGGNFAAFWDAPSFLIVVGGSFATMFIMYPMGVVIGTVKVILKCFVYKTESPLALIDLLVQLSEKARKESIVALEKVQVSDPFMARGVQLVADGTELGLLRTVLDIDMSVMQQRHWRGQDIMKSLGTYSPAFGMIGTLIGLVQMLQNMDDPSAIGPAMAVALLTTMYGSVLANCIWLPLAKKLEERSNDEYRNMELIREGIIAIQKGEHPSLLKEKLQSFLPPSMRQKDK